MGRKDWDRANQLCAGAGATQSETTAFDIAFCQ